MSQRTKKGKTHVDWSSRESSLNLQCIVHYLLYLFKFYSIFLGRLFGCVDTYCLMLLQYRFEWRIKRGKGIIKGQWLRNKIKFPYYKGEI